jgi:hypothetical protein
LLSSGETWPDGPPGMAMRLRVERSTERSRSSPTRISAPCHSRIEGWKRVPKMSSTRRLSSWSVPGVGRPELARWMGARQRRLSMSRTA